MQDDVDALVQLLDLEVIEVNVFRGVSPDENRQRIFGGQVAGQALVAAARTVEPDRVVHSLHAYFLRPGDPTVPVLYEVDRIRDGRSFTTRRVVAIQHGRAIFNLQASFQIVEPGLEFAGPMPDVVPADSLPTRAMRYQAQGIPDPFAGVGRPVDIRYVTASPFQRIKAASAGATSVVQSRWTPSRRSGSAYLSADLRVGHDLARHEFAASWDQL